MFMYIKYRYAYIHRHLHTCFVYISLLIFFTYSIYKKVLAAVQGIETISSMRGRNN